MITVEIDELSGDVNGYMTPAQAAKLWKTTINTVIGWNRRGKIPNSIKIGTAIWIPIGTEKPKPRRSGRQKKY